jgi:hypothetical protein
MSRVSENCGHGVQETFNDGRPGLEALSEIQLHVTRTLQYMRGNPLFL